MRSLSLPEIAFRRVLIHPTNVRQSIVGWKFSAASPTSGKIVIFGTFGTLQYRCPLLTMQR